MNRIKENEFNFRFLPIKEKKKKIKMQNFSLVENTSKRREGISKSEFPFAGF